MLILTLKIVIENSSLKEEKNSLCVMDLQFFSPLTRNSIFMTREKNVYPDPLIQNGDKNIRNN